MAKNETQKFLGRALEAEKEIKRLKDRERRYREMAEGLGGQAAGAGGKGGGARSKLEEAITELVDLEEYIAQRVRELTREIMEVETAVEGVTDKRGREILERKYLHGQQWVQIQTEMGYQDEKSVYRVHGWALKEVEKMLDTTKCRVNTTKCRVNTTKCGVNAE